MVSWLSGLNLGGVGSGNGDGGEKGGGDGAVRIGGTFEQEMSISVFNVGGCPERR